MAGWPIAGIFPLCGRTYPDLFMDALHQRVSSHLDTDCLADLTIVLCLFLITFIVKADEEGLTKERWELLNADGMLQNATEFYRLIYFGGVQPELRKEVWPYLLGHYAFGTTLEERKKQDETCKHYYETTMSEWLAVDAIVQQREKEKTARAVAKLSSGSNSGKNN